MVCSCRVTGSGQGSPALKDINILRPSLKGRALIKSQRIKGARMMKDDEVVSRIAQRAQSVVVRCGYCSRMRSPLLLKDVNVWRRLKLAKCPQVSTSCAAFPATRIAKVIAIDPNRSARAREARVDESATWCQGTSLPIMAASSMRQGRSWS